MKHVLLPHGPYLYLPSGAQSRPRSGDLIRGMNTVPGFNDEYLTRHNEQRYLQQLGYVDRMLGRLLAKLERTGMADHTMVLVTADHGYAWQVGVETRRSVNPSNVEELDAGAVLRARARPAAWTREGGVRPDARRGTDDRRRAGRAARLPQPTGARRSRARSSADAAWRWSRATSARWCASRGRAGRRGAGRSWRAGCASSDQVAGRACSPASARTAGLIGREVASLAARAPPARARASRATYGQVRRASGVVPAEIVGAVRGGEPDTTRALAVAVNGRIEAVGRASTSPATPPSASR